jgi:hypothetical protein
MPLLDECADAIRILLIEHGHPSNRHFLIGTTEANYLKINPRLVVHSDFRLIA